MLSFGPRYCFPFLCSSRYFHLFLKPTISFLKGRANKIADSCGHFSHPSLSLSFPAGLGCAVTFLCTAQKVQLSKATLLSTMHDVHYQIQTTDSCLGRQTCTIPHSQWPGAQQHSVRWSEFDGTEKPHFFVLYCLRVFNGLTEVFVLISNFIYCINQGTDAVRHVGTSSPCRWNRRNDGLGIGLCRYILVEKSKVKLVNKQVLSFNLESAISLMGLSYG